MHHGAGKAKEVGFVYLTFCAQSSSRSETGAAALSLIRLKSLVLLLLLLLLLDFPMHRGPRSGSGSQAHRVPGAFFTPPSPTTTEALSSQAPAGQSAHSGCQRRGREGWWWGGANRPAAQSEVTSRAEPPTHRPLERRMDELMDGGRDRAPRPATFHLGREKKTIVV